MNGKSRVGLEDWEVGEGHQGARNLMNTVLPEVISSQLSAVRSVALAAATASARMTKERIMVIDRS